MRALLYFDFIVSGGGIRLRRSEIHLFNGESVAVNTSSSCLPHELDLVWSSSRTRSAG